MNPSEDSVGELTKFTTIAGFTFADDRRNVFGLGLELGQSVPVFSRSVDLIATVQLRKRVQFIVSGGRQRSNNQSGKPTTFRSNE